uniref:HAP1 N-terminal domain-containing protein n=1 Tax=Panagrellus redivivus TaxID=6233 RepID=A0A7E4URX1_PANRE
MSLRNGLLTALKEKDLELAAKIGKSLLEQNKELRDRNDFLEDSLNSSNDTITQLKHQLQQHSNLLNSVCSLGEDFYDDGPDGGNRTVSSLQKRVKQLENENSTLKTEATSLRDFVCDVESQNQDRIDGYLKQLEAANIRIHGLQSKIAEKSTECTTQATEITRLVKEINTCKSSHKTLREASIDLHSQLSTALNAHDQLRGEVQHLQEAYTEVRGRLQAAEEELGAYRLRALPHRTGSSDSLFDSLASELEANDSGFYNTPMLSARTIDSFSVQSSSDFYSPGGSDAIEDGATSDYDVPSKALIHTVRRVRKKQREASPSLADELAMPVTSAATGTVEALNPAAKPLEAIKELQTPLSEAGGSLLAIREPEESDPEDPEGCRLTASTSDAVRETSVTTVIETSPVPAAPVKTFRDSSCSPIPGLMVDWVSPVASSSPRESPAASPLAHSSSSNASSSWNEDAIEDIEDEVEITPRAEVTVMVSELPEQPSPIHKSGSNESLIRYNGPKLGEPGKPGTRDLEYSLKKMDLRKQIERDYQRFRAARGLPPAVEGFFSAAPLPRPPPPRVLGPLSAQLAYLSSSPEKAPAMSILSRPYPSAPKTLALNRHSVPKAIGIGVAIEPGTAEGIVQRVDVTVSDNGNTSRSAESTPAHRGLRRVRTLGTDSSSGLLSALGLNALITNDDDEPALSRRSILRSTMFFGPFKADRELSPPFGVPSPSHHESLELF